MYTRALNRTESRTVLSYYFFILIFHNTLYSMVQTENWSEWKQPATTGLTDVEKLQALIVFMPWCESTININEEIRNRFSVSLTEESFRTWSGLMWNRDHHESFYFPQGPLKSVLSEQFHIHSWWENVCLFHFPY